MTDPAAALPHHPAPALTLAHWHASRQARLMRLGRYWRYTPKRPHPKQPTPHPAPTGSAYLHAARQADEVGAVLEAQLGVHVVIDRPCCVEEALFRVGGVGLVGAGLGYM